MDIILPQNLYQVNASRVVIGIMLRASHACAYCADLNRVHKFPRILSHAMRIQCRMRAPPALFVLLILVTVPGQFCRFDLRYLPDRDLLALASSGDWGQIV